MNFTKSLLTIGLVSTLLFSCKDTAGKPVAGTDESNTKKEVAVAAKPETASFKIEGMTCAMGCAKTIETKLSKMDGVQKATVDFDKKEATVEFDAAVLSTEKLTKAVETTGDGETYKVSEMKTKGKV
ncbi:heavy metal-associated domain-containing protein [Flavobacterium paronense]|uniref:Heavy-metal-associated domain-containing protein n=1 Tax=Flavobacterium paronense TaxID=1392775 RepID=A0ABV5GFC2_9FLAO|nr:heavy metal-associated domain-containing protein [Flavobacterium paronense]MDN3676028.1 heavy metal-associated domain-containing protein [Flavobacterium paronense]